jgi:hypothetical protein
MEELEEFQGQSLEAQIAISCLKNVYVCNREMPFRNIWIQDKGDLYIMI